MDRVVLKATRRDITGRKVGALRRAGQLPAVMYGHHFKSTPILLDRHDATLKLHNLTSSSLVTLELDGVEHAALVREKQRDYIRNLLLHVDFQVIELNEKIRTKVTVEVTGTAPAVKNFNGVVITGLSELDVESFPRDLPERFVVDISSLENIGDGIHVRDIKVSEKVQIHDNPDEMLVLVTGATVEEVVEVEAEAASTSEPEVIERGKKEEEE